MKRIFLLIASIGFIVFGSLGASCTKHSPVTIDPDIEVARQQMVDQKLFTEAESKTIALVASEAVVPQISTEKEVSELIGMVANDMTLSSERSLKRVDAVAATLASSKKFPDSSESAVHDFARTIITSSRGSANTSLVGSAITIFRNTQSKDALPLIRPYLNSKDPVVRRGASETVKALGGY